MATNEDIKNLFERYVTIEHEIKLLQEDKKSLLSEFKDRIDVKSFQAALRSAKIRSKIKPEEQRDFDQVLLILEKALCIEHVE